MEWSYEKEILIYLFLSATSYIYLYNVYLSSILDTNISYSKNLRKSYFFGTEIPNLKIGQKVVAESVRGMQIGVVSTPVFDVSTYKSDLELKPILRIANDVDFNGQVTMLAEEPETDLFSVASSEFKQAMIIHSDVVK